MNTDCPICGEDHDANLHGDAVVIRDWSVRDVVSMVSVALQDAMFLLADTHPALFQKICELYDEWNVLDTSDLEAKNADGVYVFEIVDEYLPDVEAILGEAGYFAYSDGDAGSWLVFGPARDNAERIIGASS
jgi:hypothetical protein